MLVSIPVAAKSWVQDAWRIALKEMTAEREEALDKLRVCEEHCAHAEREADKAASMLDEAAPCLDYGNSGHRLRFEGCDCIRCRIERGEHRRA